MILVLLAVSLGAHAQESLNEIRRSIKSVEQETAREKDLTDAEAKRHAAFAETNRQKIASLEQQQNALRGQLDSLRAEIARLHDAKQKTAGGARYFEGRKARYAQGLVAEPRRLLASIPGVEYRELPEADQCCGGGGTYQFMQPEISQAVGNRKTENLMATGVSLVLTSSVSCLLQLRAGLKRTKSKIRAFHIAEIFSPPTDR